MDEIPTSRMCVKCGNDVGHSAAVLCGAEYVDDAIHIRDDRNPEATLCLQGVTGLNVIERGDKRPDAGSGCWTCLGYDRHLPVATASKPKEKH